MSALPADQVPDASPAVWPRLTVWRGGTAGGLALYLSVCLHHFVTGRTGLGTIADVLLGLLLFVLSTSLYSLLGGALAAAGGALWFLARHERPCWRGALWQAGRRAGWCAGPMVAGVAVLVASGGIYWPVMAIAATVTVVLAGFLGAALGALFVPGWRRPLVALVVVATLGLNSAWWALVTYRPVYQAGAPGWAAPAGVQALDALGSPARPGGFTVRTLTYGSGTDRRRPEYGAEADLITAAVKAPSTLAPEPKGVLAQVRRRLWGFDRAALPLNARVWYPTEEGPFPLVLMVHGNHNAMAESDAGYAYLGELLASRGFVFASVDENFLNGGYWGDVPDDMQLRAYLLLQHLSAWKSFSETPGNPFYGKADLQNIALMGHSRGGEAAALAAYLYEQEHWPTDESVPLKLPVRIRTVVAMAPSDGFYRPGGSLPWLENVNYLLLHGLHDTDVYNFMGLKQYQRTRFDGTDAYSMKAAVFVLHANHGGMNSRWERDRSAPAAWFYEESPLLPGEQQRLIWKTYTSAFLEATLRGDMNVMRLLRNPGVGAAWLPDVPVATLFADSTEQVVAHYEEDSNEATTSWQGGRIQWEHLTVAEKRLDMRADGAPRETSGAVLTWAPGGGVPWYGVTLPGDLVLAGFDPHLVFALGDAAGDSPDLTVEVLDRAGTVARLPLSRYGRLMPLPDFPVARYGLPVVSGGVPGAMGPVLQSFEIPLDDFVAVSPRLDAAGVERVRFVFDRTASGSVVVDDVGVRAGYQR